MAKVTLRYSVPHRRRREQKTDYRKRLALVKSEKARLVIRKSLSHMRVQFVKYKHDGDETLCSVFSNELKKFGWSAGCGNIPAAYLTGLLAGAKAKKAGVGEAVLDTGLQVSTKGSRIYGALKGVIDSGITVQHSPDVLPSEDRIFGRHIKPEVEALAKSVKEKICFLLAEKQGGY